MKTGQSIFLIGAGGIVNDAHLPAYRLAGYPVAGIYDIDIVRARATAAAFNIPRVFETLSDMLNAYQDHIVFDLAIPGGALAEVLMQLPDHAVVLMQKPMGNNLQEARDILAICKRKKLIAAVNFQLRYAPGILQAKQMIREGLIGELCDIEINVNVYTPWHLWKFLYELPRVEILYHSIHYVDLIRSFLGNPSGIYAKTTRHPVMRELASVRTGMMMNYGDMIRADILTNHCHRFGLSHQHAYVKLEGTKGAIIIKLGVLLDYPHGQPDSFEYVVLEEGRDPEWKTIPVEGTWFPHAFIGSMEQVMQAAAGIIPTPDNSVEDCILTMACVEAAYHSSREGGVPPMLQ